MPDDVTPLDDSQLLVLSTMAYRLDRAGDIQPGDTLRSIANAMRDAVLERMTATGHEASDSLSQQMSYRDWLCVLDCAAGVPALADLAVDAFDIDAAFGCFMAAVRAETIRGISGENVIQRAAAFVAPHDAVDIV